MLKISQTNIPADSLNNVNQVIKSGNLVSGVFCKQFEDDLSTYLNIKYTSLVSSGTAALHLALKALNITQGDIVLVPNFTFPATINVVHLVGATPLICDVDLSSYTITPDSFQNTIENLHKSGFFPKALIVVHEFGYPVDMFKLKEISDSYGILLIEDAACALGALRNSQKVGTFGHIGCFSFHPRKILTTGEGGALTTNDLNLYKTIERLKNHGIERNDISIDFVEPGFNYRMTDFQAALGLPQLKLLDGWIEKRHLLAKAYTNKILQSNILSHHIAPPSSHPGHTWQTYMVRLTKTTSDYLIPLLRERGIETNIGAQVISQIKYVSKSRAASNDLRFNSDSLYKHTLALPLCEQYTVEDIAFVLEQTTSILQDLP